MDHNFVLGLDFLPQQSDVSKSELATEVKNIFISDCERWLISKSLLLLTKALFRVRCFCAN